MLFWQLAGEVIVLFVLVILLYKFLSEFKTKKTSFYPLFSILVLFTIGFGLRLSKVEELIDFGFFFTEISLLFTYILFTSCLILGQKRYWKIK